MSDYEKLGAFYLGKEFDLTANKRLADTVLYDSKDLTTHAVIIGMTGSGKTGLGIALLEEALIDNIPIIAIDPKGDLPNLLLQFPELRPEDFRPWINEHDALNAGLSPGDYARRQAELWRKGLNKWDQGPDRIRRLKSSAEFGVYTPGSSAGRPVNVLRSFSAPPASIQADKDFMRERIQTTTNCLLALIGMEADPITSREHIMIANILEATWATGKGLDLAGLIHAIQSPPFQRIGVMDLDAFFPAKERFALAMRLNNLLASPGFEAWMEGEPLDIGRFLFSDSGKARASIFSIAHLSDSERMFFVSMLLNEIVAWMRTQPGTTSLRALIYMDEIFGYFPPVKNPPSKGPLLTLLKQARAFGLGMVLSTQNPVDLDYKGLSNTGTWFIGRLQTERDKERVMAGLEGAAVGGTFDRQRMGEVLAGLGQRVFLMNNVHENAPVIFETRWVMSYLCGPVTRDQIRTLNGAISTHAPVQTQATVAPVSSATAEPATGALPQASQPPIIPSDIPSYYLPASGAGQGLVYYPAVAGWLDIHFQSTKYKIDASRSRALSAALEDGPVVLDWDQAEEFHVSPDELESTPVPGAAYADLPSAAKKSTAYKKWEKKLKQWVRLNCTLSLFYCKRFRLTSDPGLEKSEFLAQVSQASREQRDLAVEKLRRKYSTKFTTLQNRLMRAEQAIAREKEQAKAKTFETVISFGTAILGSFLGRKAVSAGSAGRFGTAARSAGRIKKEKMDVARATQTAEAVQLQMAELDERLQADIQSIETSFDPENETIDEIIIKPKSTNITLGMYGLIWRPYRKDAAGRLAPDWL